MKTLVAFLVFTLTLILLITSCNVNSHNNAGRGDIVVASKGFTDQDIFSELLAQQIEETTHF